MSYLSLLLAPQTQGMSRLSAGVCMGEQHESFASMPWLDAPESADPGTNGPDEQALPLGIASMEHWLDLNA